jgi:hypothetical protein
VPRRWSTCCAPAPSTSEPLRAPGDRGRGWCVRRGSARAGG